MSPMMSFIFSNIVFLTGFLKNKCLVAMSQSFSLLDQIHLVGSEMIINIRRILQQVNQVGKKILLGRVTLEKKIQ